VTGSDSRADLLVTGGIVLTMATDFEPVHGGAVAIVGDRIVAVNQAERFARWEVDRVIDARGGIILPGLINAHTHAAMTCFRGLADDLPLMIWLNEHIFPAEAKLNPEMVYAGALLACAEMILSGTTCFCDMYLFEGAVAQAARDAGMRAVVGEVLYDFPSPGYGEIERGFVHTEDLIRRWRGDPLITVAVEPHSPYLCAPELLRRSADIARTHRVPHVIHLSETRSEVERILERYGRTPVEHLAECGILGPELLACHCVVLSDGDIDLLRRHDVKVAHCPESNMKLASGIAPVPALLKAGICVGLGTDGCSSNNDLDLFSEMDTTAKLHKVATLDPTVLDARTVLRMCTADGARALGLEAMTGVLAPGRRADLIVVETDKPHMRPLHNPESQLVYSARGGDVVTSIINGRVVMTDRVLSTIDVEAAMDRVNRIADELRG
jgi:5-methylthioadenosine/S-adenosylhomocysteine deaminase